MNYIEHGLLIAERKGEGVKDRNINDERRITDRLSPGD